MHGPAHVVVRHVENAAQLEPAFAQPGDDLAGEGLARVELDKGALHIDMGIAASQGLQLIALHVQLQQRRRREIA